MKILTHSAPVGLWQEMIHDAMASCTITLSHEIEAYLSYLMMRYVNKPDVMHAPIALSFLEAVQQHPARRELALQAIGDKCLLLSGLFPKVAQKRLVKISYFVRIGQAAYLGISKTQNDLYEALSFQFVPMMDVLQS